MGHYLLLQYIIYIYIVFLPFVTLNVVFLRDFFAIANFQPISEPVFLPINISYVIYIYKRKLPKSVIFAPYSLRRGNPLKRFSFHGFIRFSLVGRFSLTPRPMHSYYTRWYWVTQKLPQIYTAIHATFPIQKQYRLAVNFGSPST